LHGQEYQPPHGHFLLAHWESLVHDAPVFKSAVHLLPVHNSDLHWALTLHEAPMASSLQTVLLGEIAFKTFADEDETLLQHTDAVVVNPHLRSAAHCAVLAHVFPDVTPAMHFLVAAVSHTNPAAHSLLAVQLVPRARLFSAVHLLGAAPLAIFRQQRKMFCESRQSPAQRGPAMQWCQPFATPLATVGKEAGMVENPSFVSNHMCTIDVALMFTVVATHPLDFRQASLA